MQFYMTFITKYHSNILNHTLIIYNDYKMLLMIDDESIHILNIIYI